jgi:TPP-dependent pyruvate/acetoin dehydrogenase alpha subunit
MRFRIYLERKGLWDDKKQKKLEAGIKEDIDKAVTEFETPRQIKADAPFDYVFGTRADLIESQRKRFLMDLEKEVGHD